MFVLIHFIFELFKISILASIYATILFLVILSLGKLKPDSWFARVSIKTFKLWFQSGLVISIGLFIYTFTYWGNHGLGDSSSLPIGNFKIVHQIDGISTYMVNSKFNQVNIEEFTFDNNNLYAKTSHFFNNQEDDYVVWDLETNKYTFFKTRTDYLLEVKQNNFPNPNEFKEFHLHYKKHWNGWRFWLLP